MRIETIVVGAVSSEVVLRGEGEPVVLLPGLGAGVSMLDALAERIAAEGFLSIGVNLRGVGGSVGPLENLTLHDYAGDVAGVIEALGASPAQVIGKAFGNRVARCLAADRPDLVRSVILLSAGGLVPAQEEAAAALRRLRDVETIGPEHLEDLGIALFSPASDPSAWLGMRRWPAAGRAQAEAGSATPVQEWCDAGSAPILVVQGLDDRIAPPANGLALFEKFPDRVHLVEIADAAHALLPEQPRAVAESVVEFLKACRAAR